MDLAGQARNERGYAMAALLVAMSIVALLMTAAMPVWKQMNQREKEEELVFRGQQYVHAITLYGRKFANTQPPSIDVLVQQRFLRKKYKDPITNDDFQLVLANQGGAPGASTPGSTTPGTQPGTQRSGGPALSAGSSSPGPSAATAPQTASRGGISQIGTQGANPAGGIMGVTSKSKDKSIRLYNGRTHYNEWVFMYQPQQTPGANTPGASPGSAVPGGGQTPFGGQRGRGNDGGGRSGGPGGAGGPGGPRPGGPGFPGNPGGPNTPNPFGTRGRQ